jgi:hypothetical protein
VLDWSQRRKEQDMDDATQGNGGDEVVTEFDQTNDKVQGLAGDGGDIDDVEGDREAGPDGDLSPAEPIDGTADDREPLVTRLVDGLDGEDDGLDGESGDRRRD